MQFQHELVSIAVREISLPAFDPSFEASTTIQETQLFVHAENKVSQVGGWVELSPWSAQVVEGKLY